MKLTKKVIDDLETTGKDYFLWDSELPGFGIKVSAAGRKTFVLQYRDDNKKTHRLSLGVYPALNPNIAREKAYSMWVDIHKGIDPSRKSPAGVLLFKEIWDDYKGSLKKKKARRSTFEMIDIIERCHIPSLLSLEVSKITRKIIIDVTSHAKPIIRTAIISFLKAAFSYGMVTEKVTNNPCSKIKLSRSNKIVRWLSNDETIRLFQILENHRNPIVRDYFLFLYYTGARVGEVQTLKWEHLDLKNKTWNKPAYLTKQKTDSYIPLLDNAIEIINRQLKEHELVFPVSRYNIESSWRRIRKKAGITDFRIHDLRHNFASMLVSKGVSLEVIGKLLGHSSYQTTQRYAHLSHTALKEALKKLQ